MIFENWEKRGNGSNLYETIHELSGIEPAELKNPKTTSPIEIENMLDAIITVKKAIDTNKKICVFGDYDVDGVTGTAILFLLLSYLGNKPFVRIPKRMSEGYGLSVNAIEEIEGPALLITVDNGITAFDAIQRAKEKELEVVILDHHLPSEKIPNADIIVDPHIKPENNGYQYFCGAGLAYKLAEGLLDKNNPNDAQLLEKLISLAAIATIADVVPLTGENRNIVSKGLYSLNAGKVTKGLESLLRVCNLTKINETDIGFKIAPILNAVGRLNDEGAKYACGCLAQDEKMIPSTANMLVEENNKRKDLVKSAYNTIVNSIGDAPTFPIVVYSPGLHRGIIGIVAGKLSDKYKAPAYVFCGEGEVLHGSARNGGTVDVKAITDKASDKLVTYGGHFGAVGLTIKKENLKGFSDTVKQVLEEMEFNKANTSTLFYDMALSPEEVPCVAESLAEFAPFGSANPEPVFMVSGISLVKKFDSYIKYIGDGSHIRGVAKGFVVIGFGMADEYKEMNEPETVDIVGKLQISDNSYGRCIQLIITDIRPHKIAT